MPRVLSKKASSQGMAPGRVSLERKVSSRSLRRNTSVSSPMADTPSVPGSAVPSSTAALFWMAENSTA